ncbi:pyridoxamine 5'-phosphate oxidase family protein [Alkaliphilus transvaalensis]|uniref:pyridoxamine 5'-phosphate oxidase family protein n=1 Tax=Alkaliphilus transvaalensis TaxID=114628 RepID=UPI00054D1A1B|nr:pyridoxamine 5'-phosphate oxidase family protein [Alkaliphilus transvaalensis]
MEMRRKDRQISHEEAEAILVKEGVGILSTVDEMGQPYGVPVNYVYANKAIYFHCALEGHKLNNIKKNNRVSFTVYGDHEVISKDFSTNYESVVTFGKAEVVDQEEKTEVLRLIIERFSPDFIKEGLAYISRAENKTAVVKINIEHMTGKRRNQ